MAYTVTDSALTTVFTPPASCSSHWTYEAAYYNSIPGGLLIQNALDNHPDTDCFPPDFEGFGRAPSVIQVYSPGACPGGYATVGGFSFSSTTTAICCPSGFSYSSTFSSINYFSTSAAFDGCISTYLASGPTTVLGRANDEDLNTTTVSGPITMWGQPITVEFEQGDLSLFTTTTSSSSPSSSGAAAPSKPSTGSRASQTAALSSQTGSSDSISSHTVSSSGIATGAIAGIAVAAIVILALLAGGAFFLRRRRRNRTPVRSSAAELYSPSERASAQVQWLRGELDATEEARPYKQQGYEENLIELDGAGAKKYLTRQTPRELE